MRALIYTASEIADFAEYENNIRSGEWHEPKEIAYGNEGDHFVVYGDRGGETHPLPGKRHELKEIAYCNSKCDGFVVYGDRKGEANPLPQLRIDI
jgi:hypothetical protein